MCSMIGENSTEGTSKKGMIVCNLVNRSDRRKVGQPGFTLSHLPDRRTGTYCIYISSTMPAETFVFC